MNVEPPDFVLSLPSGVKPTGDNGTYKVRSATEPGTWWVVEIPTLQCNCPSGTKGKSRQAHKQFGFLPYQYFCPHLRAALCYDAIAMRCLLDRERERAAKLAEQEAQAHRVEPPPQPVPVAGDEPHEPDDVPF